MARKQRNPIDPDIAADVLYAADRTCCVCRIAGKAVQIHHIDENPANGDIDNLASLCLECHHQTQIRGGFGRTLSAPLVKRYREAWAQEVAARRAHPTTGLRTPTGDASHEGASIEQATQRARHLRELYTKFLTGIQQIVSVHDDVSAAWRRGDVVQQVLDRSDKTIQTAARFIGTTVFQLKAEPGADAVSDAYDKFMAVSRRHLDMARSYDRVSPPSARMLAALAVGQSIIKELHEASNALEAAVRQHIAAVDRGA